MKNQFSTIINCFASFLLSLCIPWCLASSFNINVNPFILFVCVSIFTGVFSALSVFSKSRKQLIISVVVIAVAFILISIFSFDTIISQANYLVNCILSQYSTSFDIPEKVIFCDKVSTNADVIFVILEFLLSFINTFSLVKARRLVPCTIFCVVCLIPCFLLVTTPPAIIPIITVISILVSLYVTTLFRKINFKHHGSLVITIFCITLVFSIVVYSFIPVENYKRFDWQDKLLETAENLLNYGGSATSSYPDSIEKIQKLDEIGPIEYNGIKKLEVKPENSGELYLKGVAYANYNENEWSTLTDEQAERFPENFDAYNITKGGITQTVSVLTENKSDIIYTAYDLIDVSVDFTPVYDVMLNNDTQTQSYDLKCYTEFYNYKLDTPEYDNYVQEIYTQLPESTKEKMLEIAKKYGLDQQPIFYTPLLVKEFISKQGYYSLNTSKMPDGKDFPVWFINEAESGYCVHYATAATVMLRALGIPARYVTGYYVYADGNKWTQVTSDNAHAWVEYYDITRGWVVLEATPASFQPPSNTREDIETIPATEPQTTVVDIPETTATTNSVANNVVANPPTNTNPKTDSNALSTLVILLIISIPLITITVRYIVIKRRRTRLFNNGRNSTRTIYIYRYIEKIRKLSNNVIPDDIMEIANKAKFSNHRINDDEIRMMLSFVKDERREFYHNCNKLKGLYYKYIVII